MSAAPDPLAAVVPDFGPALLDEVLRLRFDVFVEKVFGTIVPGGTFEPNWHNEAICHVLTELAAGKRLRQTISMPPRSLKSIIASVALPAWLLGRDPSQEILCISYSEDLALKHARDFRAVVTSAWYRRAFPKMRIDRNTEGEIRTTRHGGRYATSVKGTLTGLGGNLIILDDPLKPGDAASKHKRESVNEWIRTTVPSRLNDKKRDRMLIVMQRVHMDDPVGLQLAAGGWEHLSLPAIAERDEIVALGRGRTHMRRAGEVLHPEREPMEVLERLRAELGSTAFSAQYQQAPVPAEGGLIKRNWLHYFDKAPTGGTIFQSWDTATTTGSFSDYSVCTTWRVVKGVYYLLDLVREKLEYPDLRARIISERKKWDPEHILLEDAGAAKSLIQDLRRSGNAIVACAPKESKEERLQAQSAKIQGGIVLLPRQAHWLREFVDELTGFPSMSHDDQVDSITQALAWWEKRPTRAVVGKR